MERKVLYQIKTLDKLIFRNLMCRSGIDSCDFEKISRAKMPTPTQMHIIDYLLKNPEKEVKQRELEEVLNLRRATVSGVLHTMETNDLLVRVIDEKDTRTKKIILKDKAKQIFKKSSENMRELEQLIVQDISQEDLDTFLSVIEKMKENIESTDII